MNAIDTKARIIAAAQELFAKNGFAGASVRDIAQKAEVNIAAINYHFNNKQSLYWHVFLESHNWLSEEIRNISLHNPRLEDLLWQTFCFLYDNSQRLRNVFILMLSGSFPEIDENIRNEMSGLKEMGPPGGEYIFNALSNEVGSETSEEMRLWAVETLFSSLVHWVLILSGGYCKSIRPEDKRLTLEYRKSCLAHHTQSVLAYLKNTPHFS